MNKLDILTLKWGAAREKVNETRDNLHNYLWPIVEILYNGVKMYDIGSIRDTGNGYRIETIYGDDIAIWRDFVIPHHVMNAKDPLKAAQAIVDIRDAEQAVKKKAQIKAEIERLQGLLDNPPKGITGL